MPSTFLNTGCVENTKVCVAFLAISGKVVVPAGGHTGPLADRAPPDRLEDQEIPTWEGLSEGCKSPPDVNSQESKTPFPSLTCSGWSPELTLPTALTSPPFTPSTPATLGQASRHSPTALPLVSCPPTSTSHRCQGDHSKSFRGSLLPEGYNSNSRASPGQAQMALSQPAKSPLTSRLTAR